MLCHSQVLIGLHYFIVLSNNYSADRRRVQMSKINHHVVVYAARTPNMATDVKAMHPFHFLWGARDPSPCSAWWMQHGEFIDQPPYVNLHRTLCHKTQIQLSNYAGLVKYHTESVTASPTSDHRCFQKHTWVHCLAVKWDCLKRGPHIGNRWANWKYWPTRSASVQWTRCSRRQRDRAAHINLFYTPKKYQLPQEHM